MFLGFTFFLARRLCGVMLSMVCVFAEGWWCDVWWGIASEIQFVRAMPGVKIVAWSFLIPA